jgi:hypothetical protein
MHLKEVVYTKYPNENWNIRMILRETNFLRKEKEQLYKMKHLSSRREKNQMIGVGKRSPTHPIFV